MRRTRRWRSVAAVLASVASIVVVAAETVDPAPRPVAGLDDGATARYRLGEAVFNTPFESGADAPRRRAGLGPRFNSPACDACHNGARRGGPPEDGSGLAQAVAHVAVVATPGAARINWPLRSSAIAGLAPDGEPRLRWRETEGRFADGTPYSLRAPVLEIATWRAEIGTLAGAGLRTPGAIAGLGLLEAVPDAALAVRADPADRDGDGISGRLARVRDASGRARSGRFGWKAAQPDLRSQSAAALAAEMGLSTSLARPPEAATDTTVELDDELLDALTAFQRDLAPPQSTPPTEATQHGVQLFRAWRCSACHTESLTTGPVTGTPWLSNRTFAPYTDLLLHDLGPGLAAPVGEAAAAAAEWRTAPLWGLTRVGRRGSPRTWLHDGRARSVSEAILWHGGEAAVSQTAFVTARAGDRAALLEFLDTL